MLHQQIITTTTTSSSSLSSSSHTLVHTLVPTLMLTLMPTLCVQASKSGGHKVKVAGIMVYEWHPRYPAASAAVLDMVQSMLATRKEISTMRAGIKT